jgi:hypothetical protein
MIRIISSFFSWNGTIEKAQQVEKELDKFVRYHWLSAPKEEYFEFRIEKNGSKQPNNSCN